MSINISLNFFKKDPNLWNDDPEFMKAQRSAQSWMVVNDMAERGVAMFQEWKPLLAKEETLKQQYIAGFRAT